MRPYCYTELDYKVINRHADYETLYHAAFNYLTDIGNMVVKAQQGLEEMYLEQTEPIPTPEHLKLADAGDIKDTPT
jgi:hypothetical protein